jgi:hypothetical protein
MKEVSALISIGTTSKDVLDTILDQFPQHATVKEAGHCSLKNSDGKLLLLAIKLKDGLWYVRKDSSLTLNKE